jgi:hypothetical protein
MARISASDGIARQENVQPVFKAFSLLLCFLSGCAAPTATRTSMGQVGGAQLTAVFSRTDKSYVRPQNPDGSFQPETYELKDGGNFGGPRVDATMDKLSFEDVSRVIEAPLASQQYIHGDDPATTSLVIMVYWGATIVPDDANPKDTRDLHVSSGDLDERIDGQIDAKSANILGYTDEIFRTSPLDPKMKTLQAEIEQDRYYVVLLAYDSKAARRYGLHRLLWETRFSIPEPGNDFEKAFPQMASIAAKYFGQDSHGLIHHNLGEGHVQVGEATSVGTLPEKKDPHR